MQIQKITASKDFKIPKSSNTLSIDLDKISFPLTLRQWQNGDWFIPIGMRGKKKISDFFTDNKFSLIDKENTWLLCSGENIVWVVGHRPDDRFKITKETKSILQITI